MAASDPRLRVVITVDGKEYEAVIDRLDAKTRKLGKTGRESAAGLTHLKGVLGLLAGAFAAVQFGQLAKKIIDINVEFGRLNATLRSLTGSQSAADEAFGQISELASQSAYQVTELTDSYIRLKGFGLDPLDGTMKTLMDQAAQLGGGQERLNGIILAVGQAWAKQKLQGEEILQLVERGVPVWDMLSSAMGKSTGELQKLSSQGKLGRREIKLLLDEMERRSMGAAAEQARELGGRLSNLEDAAARAARAFGERSGFNAVVGEAAAVLTRLFDSFSVDEEAKALELFNAQLKPNLELLREYNIFIREVDANNLGKVRAALFAADLKGLDLEYEAQLSNIRSQIKQTAASYGVLAKQQAFLNQEYGAGSKAAQENQKKLAYLESQLQRLSDAYIDAAQGADALTDAQSPTDTQAVDAARGELQKLNEDLASQNALFGMSRTEALEYRLTLGDLADEVARLGPEGEALRQSILDQARAMDEAETQARAEEEALRARQQLMELGRRVTESVKTDYEVLTDKIRTYQGLLAAGAIDQETFNRAVEAAGKEFAAAAEQSAEVIGEWEKLSSEFGVQAARNIQSAFADFLFNPLEDGFDGLLKGFVTMLRRMIAELMAKKILMDLFSAGAGLDGGLGQFFSSMAAGVKHAGGTVGSGSGVNRNVSPALFAGAPRYHTGGVAGLKPGEVPIIAQAGETIVPKGGLVLPAPRVEINNYSGQPVETETTRVDGETVTRVTIGQAAADVRRGGELSRAIAQTFGLRRAPVGVR